MLKFKYIKTFENFLSSQSYNTNIIVEKGNWVEIKSNKSGLVYLGRVVKDYTINETNSKFLILDCENDFRLIESNDIKICNMKKDLRFNIARNSLPIIS